MWWQPLFIKNINHSTRPLNLPNTYGQATDNGGQRFNPCRAVYHADDYPGLQPELLKLKPFRLLKSGFCLPMSDVDPLKSNFSLLMSGVGHRKTNFSLQTSCHEKVHRCYILMIISIKQELLLPVMEFFAFENRIGAGKSIFSDC